MTIKDLGGTTTLAIFSGKLLLEPPFASNFTYTQDFMVGKHTPLPQQHPKNNIAMGGFYTSFYINTRERNSNLIYHGFKSNFYETTIAFWGRMRMKRSEASEYLHSEICENVVLFLLKLPIL